MISKLLVPYLEGYSNKRYLFNKTRCYLWALLNCGQLPEQEFYPILYRSYRTWVLSFDFGIVQGKIEGYQYGFDFRISNSIWHSYLEAFEVPPNKREELIDPIPF